MSQTAKQQLRQKLNEQLMAGQTAAKWIPREKSSKSEIAREIREFFGMSPRQYRKQVADLSETVEDLMCSGSWDPQTGASKGYAFISYDSFEASDLAIECMNGQYLCNRQIVVQYAFKKETPGERHGSQAERILAATQPQRLKPNGAFGGPAEGTMQPPPMPGLPGMPPAMPGFPQDFQYMQYAAANPLLMQQMSAFGFGMGMPGVPGVPGMPPPPPLPIIPAAPMMPFLPGAGMIPPPPPPPPQH